MHAIFSLALAAAAPEPPVGDADRDYDGPDAAESVDDASAAEPAPSEPPPRRPAEHTSTELTLESEAEPAPSRGEKIRDQLDRVFTPTALVEADYRQRADDVEGKSGFALARARLGMRLTPTDWLLAVGNVEFVGSDGPYLLDGYATFTPLRWLELTAGYSKPPLFASFRYEPVNTLPSPVRSPVVGEMRVRRDVGAEARFRPHRAPIEAIVRLGNGVLGFANDNNTPTGYAALDLVLGRAWVAGQSKVVGLRMGAASLLDDTAPHNAISASTPLGYTYVEPVAAEGLRSITEAHLIGYAGPVRLVVESAFGYESRREDHDDDPATPVVDADAVQSWGLTGELVWTIRGKWREEGWQPAGPGDRGDRWDGGAVELAGRVDRQWLGLGTSEVGDRGGTSGSLSLKWWPTFFLALDLYGDMTRFDVPPIETPTRSWSWSALARGSFFWGRRPRA